jgi:hypothetical protein
VVYLKKTHCNVNWTTYNLVRWTAFTDISGIIFISSMPPVVVVLISDINPFQTNHLPCCLFHYWNLFTVSEVDFQYLMRFCGPHLPSLVMMPLNRGNAIYFLSHILISILQKWREGTGLVMKETRHIVFWENFN